MHEQYTPPETIASEKQIVMRLAQLPDADRIIFNDTGWDSRVYVIDNGRYVVKFPRTPKVQGRYASQIVALRLAAHVDSGMLIPKVVWTHPNNEYFGYEGIQGFHLSDVLATLDASAKETIGTKLGNFLKQFHQLDLPGARDMGIDEEVVQLQKWFEKILPHVKELFRTDEVHALSTAVYRMWPDELAELGNDIALSHGDFHFENIFYTPEGRLGVIDFGDICYADRTKDFINLDDPVIFEAALSAYGDTSQQFRQKIALRKRILEIIKLATRIIKDDESGIERAVAQIRADLNSKK